MKYFEQTFATCLWKTLATYATAPDLFLQHQDETIASYIWNVWNTWNIHMQHRTVEGRVGRFQTSGWEPTVSHDAWAPPAPPMLVGAHGSAKEDLRHHGMCAPAAMAGSAAHATTMEDGRRGSKRHRWLGRARNAAGDEAQGGGRKAMARKPTSAWWGKESERMSGHMLRLVSSGWFVFLFLREMGLAWAASGRESRTDACGISLWISKTDTIMGYISAEVVHDCSSF
jgi:hypothetical protein